MNLFATELARRGKVLERGPLEILQINVGRRCNQACKHCHVDASPSRPEMMDTDTAKRVVEWIERFRPATVDITGGAPELNPNFRLLVERSRAAGCEVIDRNNLTILEEPGYEWLPGFLAAHEAQVIASLPCYSEQNVDAQRGQGVFEKSIRGLRKLNAQGYGAGRLKLHLVYNPVGAKLPPPQQELEENYKEALGREFGIRFDRLLTLTNQPIARFAADLRRRGALEDYMRLLLENFNLATLKGLMCRNTLSVDYRGKLYDCDFNQMLDLEMGMNLWDMIPEQLAGAQIRTGLHCLACTAGAGSSCQGSLAEAEVHAGNN